MSDAEVSTKCQEALTVPAGFVPLDAPLGPYFRALGPVYQRPSADGTWVFGLRLVSGHTNVRGIPHGGMLVTLADAALGIHLMRARQPPRGMVTVSLHTDFLAAAAVGDWLEAHPVVRRTTRQLSFGDCTLRVGSKEVLRASGVFAVVEGGPHPAAMDG